MRAVEHEHLEARVGPKLGQQLGGRGGAQQVAAGGAEGLGDQLEALAAQSLRQHLRIGARRLRTAAIDPNPVAAIITTCSMVLPCFVHPK